MLSPHFICTYVAAQLSKPAESAKKPCAAQLAFHFAATNWFCLLWCLQIYRRLRIFMNMHVLTYTHMYTYTATEMYACKRQIEQSRAISTLTSYIWYYSCPQYINTYPPYIQALSTHTCAHSSDFHFSKCHWSFLCIDWFPLFQCRKLKKLIARPFIRGPQAAFQYLVRAHCATIYYKRRYSREDWLPEKQASWNILQLCIMVASTLLFFKLYTIHNISHARETSGICKIPN